MKDQNMPCGHKWSDYVSCAVEDSAYMCGKCSPIGTRVAQLKADIDALIEWAKTDNPIEGREKWYALPKHIKDRVAPCPNVEPDEDTGAD